MRRARWAPIPACYSRAGNLQGVVPGRSLFTCNDGCCVHAHHIAIGARKVARTAGTDEQPRAAALLPGTLAAATDA